MCAKVWHSLAPRVLESLALGCGIMIMKIDNISFWVASGLWPQTWDIF